MHNQIVAASPRRRRDVHPTHKLICAQATFDYNDGEGNVKQLPLFGELVEAAFYYSDRAEEDDSLPKPVWKSTSVSGAQFFTKSFHGDDAADLARSSGEEPTSSRRRAGVASMAWRTAR